MRNEFLEPILNMTPVKRPNDFLFLFFFMSIGHWLSVRGYLGYFMIVCQEGFVRNNLKRIYIEKGKQV